MINLSKTESFGAGGKGEAFKTASIAVLESDCS
jgi:hypothetical protein